MKTQPLHKPWLRRIALPTISAGAWFVTPFFVLFFVFGLAGLLFSLMVSFTDWDPFTGDGSFRFDGVAGYSLVFQDRGFWFTLRNTLKDSLGLVVVQHAIAIPLAFALHMVFKRALGFFGVIFLLPMVASPDAQAAGLGILLRLIGNPLSDGLQALHKIIPQAPNGFTPSLFEVGFSQMWVYVGWNILLYLMALSALPRSLLEAASLDGAGYWRQLTKIAIPIIRPMIFVAVCMSIFRSMQSDVASADCGAMRDLDFPAINTPGYIYCTAFRYGLIAMSNNQTWVFFLSLVLIIVGVYFWIGRNFTALETSAGEGGESSSVQLSKISTLWVKICVWTLTLFCIIPILLILFKATQELLPEFRRYIMSWEEFHYGGGGFGRPPAPVSPGTFFALGDATLISLKALLVFVPDFWKNFWNSIYISGLAGLGSSAVSALGGYAFAHLQFRNKDRLFAVVMSAMLFPSVALTVPYLFQMNQMGWIDSPRSLWVPFCVSALGVFLVRQFAINAIPSGMLEAARVDGASELGIFRRIALPNLVPVIATVGVLTFLTLWNQSYMAWLLLRNPETRILPQALGLLASPFGGATGSEGLNIQAANLGSAIGLVPLLIVMLIAAKYLGSGLGLGGGMGFSVSVISPKKFFAEFAKPHRRTLVDGADAVRVFACLMVMMAHTVQRSNIQGLNSWLYDIRGFFENGGKVSALFVLSGCLLSYRFWVAYLAGKPVPSLTEFARRRFLRIAPAYWSALTVGFLLARTYGHEREEWLRYLSGMTFTSAYHYLTFFPIEFDGPLWTISFEVFCYILMPILMAGLFYFSIAIRRRNPVIAFGFWLLSLAVVLFAHDWIVNHIFNDEFARGFGFGQIGGAKFWMPRYNVIGFFGHFSVGVLAAGWIALRRSRVANPNHWIFDLLSFASFSGLVVFIWWSKFFGDFTFSLSDQPYYFPSYAILVALVLISTPFSVWFYRVLDNAFVRFSAKIAFGIYIWHYIVLELIRTFHNPAFRYRSTEPFSTWIALAVITFVLTYLIAYLSYVHIEKPFWPKKTERNR